MIVNILKGSFMGFVLTFLIVTIIKILANMEHQKDEKKRQNIVNYKTTAMLQYFLSVTIFISIPILLFEFVFEELGGKSNVISFLYIFVLIFLRMITDIFVYWRWKRIFDKTNKSVPYTPRIVREIYRHEEGRGNNSREIESIVKDLYNSNDYFQCRYSVIKKRHQTICICINLLLCAAVCCFTQNTNTGLGILLLVLSKVFWIEVPEIIMNKTIRREISITILACLLITVILYLVVLNSIAVLLVMIVNYMLSLIGYLNYIEHQGKSLFTK